MLPKIHKLPDIEGCKFKTRPVISSCGAPLNRIAQFLDFYLLPEVKKSNAYLKDTADTIRKVESLVLPKDIILASVDVVGMFSAVPQNEAYEVAMQLLAKLNPWLYDPPMPSLRYMGKLLKLVLYRNAFEFNGKFYLQTSGCPMGLRSSPSLCCLVVNKLLEKVMSENSNVVSFNIYMDDSFLTWNNSIANLKAFIASLNTKHPSLQFTYTASEKEVQFLDLVIYKGERFKTQNILDVRCFTKPTETWCYLDRSSCHSPAVFKGFIKAELTRYVRNCNNIASYETKKKIFTEKLRARGYSRQEIQKASNEVDFQDRHKYVEEKEKAGKIPLVFKINYHPQIESKHIKNALTKHWDIISKDPELRRIFPEIPIIAFSRTKNLSDDLVRARMQVPVVEEKRHEPRPETTRPGSPTLHMLQDLETESRGFNDTFFFNTSDDDYECTSPPSSTSQMWEELEEENRHI